MPDDYEISHNLFRMLQHYYRMCGVREQKWYFSATDMLTRACPFCNSPKGLSNTS